MKRILYSTIAFLISIASISAQQQDYVRFNYENQFIYNSGQTALTSELLATCYHQKKFTGVANAPTVLFASLQYPLINDNLGIGASVFSENEGLLNNTNLSLNVSYKIKTNFIEDDFISVGLGANLGLLGFDSNRLSSAVERSDNTLAGDLNRSLGINANIGVVYSSYSGKFNPRNRYGTQVGYQIGISTGKLINNQININNIQYNESRFYNISGRVDFKINENLVMSGLVETLLERENILDVRLSTRAIFSDFVLAGLGFDRNKILTLEIGAQTDKLFGDGRYGLLLNGSIPFGDISNYINSGYGLKFIYGFDLGRR